MIISKKIYTIIGVLFVSVLGTLAHFFYKWSGNNTIIGLFAPVNESTWEHMKLFFFAMVLFLLLSWITSFHVQSCSYPLLLSNLVATWLIPVSFYTYSGILGFHIPVIDIGIFYVCVVIAFLLPYWSSFALFARKYVNIVFGLSILMAIEFLIFTYWPLDIGLFQPPVI